MSRSAEEPGSGTVVGRLRAVVRGAEDSRVRATWRVLLAMPVLWVLTGGVLAGNVQSAVVVIPSGRNPAAGLAQSLLHGGFFTVALVAWARYLDRRPLSDYGVSASPRWVLEALGGFAAVVVGFGAWLALGAVLGVTTVAVSTSSLRGSLSLEPAIILVALAIHAAIQQVVFFRVVLGNAAEGLQDRGVAPSRAAVGALAVAVLFFVGMHELSSALRVIDLAVAGLVFGLLYLHTGELALGIGAHLGALYAGVLFAVFQVTGSLPGILGAVGQYGFPKMVVAYLVVVAWLAWRRGGVSIESGTARWTER